MQDFPIYTDNDRRLALAYWCEQVGLKTLGLPKVLRDQWESERTLRQFDVYVTKLEAGFEIKGKSNMDQPKIFEDQLDGHLEKIGCQVDWGMLWLVGYVNHKRYGNQKENCQERLFKKESGSSWHEFSRWMAEHSRTVHVVDLQFLDLWRRTHGTKPYRRDKDRDRRLVHVTRTDLADFAADPSLGLQRLGLNEFEIAQWYPDRSRSAPSWTITNQFEGSIISFDLNILAPQEFTEAFLHLLRMGSGEVRKSKAA